MKLTAYNGKAIGLYSPREFYGYIKRMEAAGHIEPISLHKKPRREDIDTTDVYRFKLEEVILSYLHDWTTGYPYRNRVTINLYGQKTKCIELNSS